MTTAKKMTTTTKAKTTTKKKTTSFVVDNLPRNPLAFEVFDLVSRSRTKVKKIEVLKKYNDPSLRRSQCSRQFVCILALAHNGVRCGHFVIGLRSPVDSV